MGDDEYPVGAAARLAGISVRSLHHYPDFRRCESGIVPGLVA